MTTIFDIVNMYHTVLNGGTFTINDYTISSNGKEWLVDGRSVDTIENHKKRLDSIVEKVELAKNLLNSIGEDTNEMDDEYYLIHDANMTLLVKKVEGRLVLVYITESIVETEVMIEQIDIEKGTMKCNYFKQRFNELKPSQFYLEGALSAKSLNLINFKLSEEVFSVTQNFYYDMFFEGMTNYHDLIQAIISNPIEPSKGIRIQQLRRVLIVSS